MTETKRFYKIKKAKIERSDQPEQHYYIQVGVNGETLNTSELYTRHGDAVRGVEDANPDGNFEIIEE